MQDKFMNVTWFSYGWVGGGCLKLEVTKKHSSYDENINMIIASAMAKDLKMKYKSKSKATDDSNLDYDLDHFNFEDSILDKTPNQNNNMSTCSG